MPGPARKLDLNETIRDPGFRTRVSIESPETMQELESRLRREEAQHEHERYKERVILWGVVVTLGVVTLACVALVLMPGTPAETSKWASTVLTTIVAGGVGYVMGGKGSK